LQASNFNKAGFGLIDCILIGRIDSFCGQEILQLDLKIRLGCKTIFATVSEMNTSKQHTLEPTTSTHLPTLGLAPQRGRLDGRSILIIGGGQRKTVESDPPIGNGRAMSVLFAREGAKVVVLDSNLEAAEATVSQIKAEGGEAFPLLFDVRNSDAIPAIISKARQFLGSKLDGVVLNAAYSRGLPLNKITAKSWNDEFAVNVTANALFLKECVAMKGVDDGGAVVLISSMAGQRASGAGVTYESAKASLGGLVRSGARFGEPRGVRCNGVAMGYVDTPMGRDASRHTAGRAYRVPFGRQATGWETAHTALFLISNDASYISGHVVNMDGGMSTGSDGRVRSDISTKKSAQSKL
jgi:NAD(P)-dependent dehydrogenase (short-subunit alcohol dehydrogenase family)